MMKRLAGALIASFILAALAIPAQSLAQTNNPNTDWMSGYFGIGFHYLQDKYNETKNGGSTEWNNAVNSFDVNNFATAAQSSGAKWVLFTVGQNSGYYDAPNATLNGYSGYKPGERNSNRDLIMDLANALNAKGIKLVLYLPSNAPKSDSKIAKGMGLTTQDSNGNWHVNEAFVQKWAKVIQEWSDRYGSKVAGWWFDGFYAGNGFVPSYGKYYSDAAKHGNSKAVIALNPGASKWNQAASTYQDYLAGEQGSSLHADTSGRWFTGTNGIGPVQWHAFSVLGNGWFSGGTPFSDSTVKSYMSTTKSHGGAITWDLYTSINGTIDQSQINQLKRTHP